MIDEKIFKREETAVFALRSLYRKYGYLPYKMSKFEEFEFYIRNKDFLVSDRIITFNDTNGKLLALKPDVTLSIIKNAEDAAGCKQKVFYNEHVYRVSDNTHQFKELPQTGLECIGDIDLYDIYETVSLAAQSLALIAEGDFVLEISDQSILAALLNAACGDETFQKQAAGYIAGKNAHDLGSLCAAYGVNDAAREALTKLITVYGKRQDVLAVLENICADAAAEQLAQLRQLSGMLEMSPYSENIVFDFSVVNDMNYYNGIVFKGFVSGICDGILAGGQYDKLMEKLEKKSGAVGFALYLDLLEQLPVQKSEYDIDVLLLYDAGCDKAVLAQKVAGLTAAGKTVSAQKNVPPKIRCKEMIDLRKDGKEC